MEYVLTLSEKIYLLSVHPKKGGIVGRAFGNMNLIIASAVLLELLAGHKIRIEGKKVFLAEEKNPTPVQKLVLDKIGKAEKKRRVFGWIQRVSRSYRKIKKYIIQSLTDKHLIKTEQKRFLFLNWKKVWLLDRKRVADLVDEIEGCIFRATESEEQQYLLSLLVPSGLIFRLFPVREKRRLVREKLKQMGIENVVSKALADAIRTKRAAAT